MEASCQKVDVGVLECSQRPLPLQHAYTVVGGCCTTATGAAAGSGGGGAAGGGQRSFASAGRPAREAPPSSSSPCSLVDPFGCQDPRYSVCDLDESMRLCCIAPGWTQGTGASLFQPCLVCSLRAASIVEVPCGHITVCDECYADYKTNSRCLRCRDQVAARVDIKQFLDELGRPEDCYMCKSSLASVVTVPCVHMCLCAQCLPQRPAGCPTCGERVERTCVVKWSAAAATSAAAGSGGPQQPPSEQGAASGAAFSMGTVVAAAAGGHSMPRQHVNGHPRYPPPPSEVSGVNCGRSGGRSRGSAAVEAAVAREQAEDSLDVARDVDQEILRLEQQLRRLRTLASSSTRTTTSSTSCSARTSRPLCVAVEASSSQALGPDLLSGSGW